MGSLDGSSVVNLVAQKDIIAFGDQIWYVEAVEDAFKFRAWKGHKTKKQGFDASLYVWRCDAICFKTELGTWACKKVKKGYTYKVVEWTCIDDIPKSIKMASTPNKCSSAISLSTDLTSLKFLKTVIALTPAFKTASRRGWAMSCARESTSIPTKYFNSGWPLITCFIPFNSSGTFYSVKKTRMNGFGG